MEKYMEFDIAKISLVIEENETKIDHCHESGHIYSRQQKIMSLNSYSVNYIFHNNDTIRVSIKGNY